MCVVIDEGGCTWAQGTTTISDSDYTSSPSTGFTTTINTDADSSTVVTTSNYISTTDAITADSITTTNIPSTTEITVETTTPGICPDNFFGNIPHPELCNSWYLCAGGMPIQLFCSDGFEYDPIQGVSTITFLI